eukprot:1859877-Rhodomonas_salina.1
MISNDSTAIKSKFETAMLTPTRQCAMASAQRQDRMARIRRRAEGKGHTQSLPRYLRRPFPELHPRT